MIAQHIPPSADGGLLYTVPSAQTDIRRTFREKYGWVGPQEQRELAEIINTEPNKGASNG